jgi:hypothetical protein
MRQAKTLKEELETKDYCLLKETWLQTNEPCSSFQFKYTQKDLDDCYKSKWCFNCVSFGQFLEGKEKET